MYAGLVLDNEKGLEDVVPNFACFQERTHKYLAMKGGETKRGKDVLVTPNPSSKFL